MSNQNTNGSPKKKWKTKAGIAAVTIGMVGGLGYVGTQTDMGDRALREFENRTTQKIETQEGYYEGQTNFGIFEGEGSFHYNTGKTDDQ